MGRTVQTREVRREHRRVLGDKEDAIMESKVKLGEEEEEEKGKRMKLR